MQKACKVRNYMQKARSETTCRRHVRSGTTCRRHVRSGTTRRRHVRSGTTRRRHVRSGTTCRRHVRSGTTCRRHIRSVVCSAHVTRPHALREQNSCTVLVPRPIFLSCYHCQLFLGSHNLHTKLLFQSLSSEFISHQNPAFHYQFCICTASAAIRFQTGYHRILMVHGWGCYYHPWNTTLHNQFNAQSVYLRHLSGKI